MTSKPFCARSRLDKISIVTLPGKDSLTSGHGLSPVQHGVFNAIEMFEHPPITKFLIGGANAYRSKIPII